MPMDHDFIGLCFPVYFLFLPDAWKWKEMEQCLKLEDEAIFVEMKHHPINPGLSVHLSYERKITHPQLSYDILKLFYYIILHWTLTNKNNRTHGNTLLKWWENISPFVKRILIIFIKTLKNPLKKPSHWNSNFTFGNNTKKQNTNKQTPTSTQRWFCIIGRNKKIKIIHQQRIE